MSNNTPELHTSSEHGQNYPMPKDNPSTAICGRTVSWWDGEYEGECELPEDHPGPHYDGVSAWIGDGDSVELKEPPVPPLVLNVSYYKNGVCQARQSQVLDGQHRILTLQPEPGVEVRVEL